MTHVLLLGAGNIGVAVAELLGRTQDYKLTIADRDAERLVGVHAGVEKLPLDVTDRAALAKALAGVDVVLSAMPFFLNTAIAELAREAGVHYFDLTEDVETAHRVRELAEGAKTVFIPQCGLAPGFISIAANDLAKRFDKLNRVRMRVGALPLFPSNALKYNLTWSTAGLINEYCNPCHVIHDGSVREVLPLEGLEAFSLDGVEYEAFNTSGGLGTLYETLQGKVDYLNYKTIRYPGHCELIRFLCNDLRLGERRKLFEDVLEHAVPVTTQDVVLIFVTVSGSQNGRLVQETYTKKVYHGRVGGTELSAIQITTAAGLCAMVDLHREGKLPKSGFVKQEDVPLAAFLGNRFGKYYG
ncbi:MAG TPA: saccharopine dehydrogenase NADP-binding domain-containing protein [Polyangiales bacterium]|jgi:saccharopine dehydrogenase-like NADP-dependent oxidoreductase|nr:saccharopine dehydrogenase NADP-binding domain-containing protein [Polyangiales bacterium]